MIGENLLLLCKLLSVVSPTPTLISSLLNCRLLKTIPDPFGSWTLGRICQCKHSWGIGKWKEGKVIHLTITVVVVGGAMGD